MAFKDKVLKVILEENMQQPVGEFINNIKKEIMEKLSKEVLEHYFKAVELNNTKFLENMKEWESKMDAKIEQKIKQLIVPN